MSHDFWFWLVAGIAIFLTGVSKGGVSGLTLMAVPIMALVMSPVQAAGIMLPILILMDMFALSAWRKHFDKRALKYLIPPAIIGIAIGGLTASFVSEDGVRILVGLIAVGFVAYMAVKRWFMNQTGHSEGSPLWGALAGLTSGFTSTIAHAGSPPVKAWLLPQGLSKDVLTGTSVMFFAVVNAVKLVPYYFLGQLAVGNLKVALFLAPLAPIGVFTGVWLVKRIPERTFYAFLYAMVLVVGLKLLWDGASGILHTG